MTSDSPENSTEYGVDQAESILNGPKFSIRNGDKNKLRCGSALGISRHLHPHCPNFGPGHPSANRS